MTLLDVHERANAAIEDLDVALARSVESGNQPDLVARAATIRPLPDVDYGTRGGCDRGLVEVGRRIQQIEDLHVEDASLTDSRDRALTACRDLAEAIKNQRANLGLAGAEDD